MINDEILRITMRRSRIHHSTQYVVLRTIDLTYAMTQSWS